MSAASEHIEMKTTGAHAWFTLVACSFVLFEMLFVTLFSNEFWFDLNLRWLGPVAVLLVLPIAHLLLTWQESPAGCNFLSFIWKQKPPIVYRRWLSINDPAFDGGIRFGNKNLAWSAIDSVELSFFCNLVFRSRTVSGSTPLKERTKLEEKITQPEVVLKIPFGVSSYENQKKLIGIIEQNNPSVTFNERLTKRLATPELKAAAKIPQLGAVFLTLVLLDVGYSTFSYLETLKGFYLSQTNALAGKKESAETYFAQAKDIKNHPLPISWVTAKLTTQKPVGPGLCLAQADALWAMGKRDQAIESAQKALELSPKNFRTNLQLARMYSVTGRAGESEKQLALAMDNHKDSFLPQLYMVALKQTAPVKIDPASKDLYKKYKNELDDELFADEPHWPPGGDRFLHDVWYRKDVEFVLNKFLGD